MIRNYLVISALLLAGPLRAGTMTVNISCGYLFDAAGISALNRLPADTLCVLVADLAGDGFDPPLTGWVADDDLLVVVSDSEFPASAGGTRAFDLAAGTTEPGLFSRSLVIDPAQFPGRTQPLPVALRWFPGYKAGTTDVTLSGPAAGSAYGEFSRAVPLYPETGSVPWALPLPGGENVTLDPFATPEFSGIDSRDQGRASRTTGIPEGSAPAGLTLQWSAGNGVVVEFSGTAGFKYKVQRSTDLLTWPAEWTVTVSAEGRGRLTDSSAPAGRGFYRVAGPVNP